MDRKWLPLNALRAFEAAGQHLSFTAAANSLTVAQSAVSRHVMVLEDFLGVTLFERRPQQLVLTEAGRHILRDEGVRYSGVDKTFKRDGLDYSRLFADVVENLLLHPARGCSRKEDVDQLD